MDEHILALSWNIATEPKLYRKLAPNPYTPSALRILSERFPDADTADVIRAVVLAEQEAIFDWNFRELPKAQQKEKLSKQKIIFAQAKKRLAKHCTTYAKAFSSLPKEFIYASLCLSVFETADVKEIEQTYGQNQRRDLRLSIVNYIEASDIKYSSRRPLFRLVLATLSLLLLFSLAQILIQSAPQYSKVEKQVLGIEAQKENQNRPIRLTIPAINVQAAIQQVGVTPEGEMDVPSNTSDVAWFKPGPRPGERGSAVIAGHFDGENNDTGVFTNLYKLKKGDKVYIENDIGISIAFVVRESRIYNPGYADDVFSASDGTHLNLITCDGAWDGAKKSYSKRLVVFADSEQ